MNDLIKFVDEYKIFNYLVPGVVVTCLVGDGSFLRKVENLNIFIEFFVFYFVGLIISRMGSLLVENLLKRSKLVKFADYSDYIEASKKDEVIGKLSQENNTYRTYIAAFLVIGAFNVVDRTVGGSTINTRESWLFLTGTLVLIVVMVLSYRKQTEYVVKRIKHTQR